METFIKSLAVDLHRRYADKLGDLCIVFPNRRASLFLQKHLAACIEHPVWLPTFYSLEDFVVRLTSLRKAENHELMAMLYDTLCEVVPETVQSFPSFLPWGQMLLSDFDEIDQHLAPGKAVFDYLDEIKALEKWNPDGTPLTHFEKDYLRFYHGLGKVYSAFRNTLKASGKGYFGFLISELLSTNQWHQALPWEKVIFVGFNALTLAEEKLMSTLVEAKLADTYWDGDPYYVDRPEMEAGHFLRRLQREKPFGDVKWVRDYFKADAKEIKISGVAGFTAQTRLAGARCSEMLQQGVAPGSIAIVLLDEGLLLPMLNYIPAQAGDFNVTMGYPFRQTVTCQLVYLWFSLMQHASAKPGPHGGMQVSLRRADVEAILNNPIVASLIDRKHGAVKTKYNAFVSTQEFSGQFGSLSHEMSSLFNAIVFPLDARQALRACLTFLSMLNRIVDGEGAGSGLDANTVEKAALPVALQVLDVMQSWALQEKYRLEPTSLPEIFQVLSAQARIPFYGEPLNGLQVMGMLETRLLDFEHLIILSAEEGNLPKARQRATFVPDEVKTAYGLPRYHEKNAVTAYHFYRLVQRARTAHIYYNTKTDGMGGGEMSRFLSQLVSELPAHCPNIQIDQVQPMEPLLAPDKYGLAVAKSGPVLQQLKASALKGFSPSALAVYLSCQLRFYYMQVLGLREVAVIPEIMDVPLMGTVLHDALQRLYLPYVSKSLTAESQKGLVQQAGEALWAALLERYRKEDVESGANLLAVKVASRMLDSFLQAEQSFLQSNGPIQIIALETRLQAHLTLQLPNEDEAIYIKIHGQADRIDRVADTIRILDYKTGKVEDKELTFDELGDLLHHPTPAKLLQLMMYAWMYHAENPALGAEGLLPGIIALQHPHKNVLTLLQGKQEFRVTASELGAFETVLTEMLQQIFDPGGHFEPTADMANCRICPYTALCNRVIA